MTCHNGTGVGTMTMFIANENWQGHQSIMIPGNKNKIIELGKWWYTSRPSAMTSIHGMMYMRAAATLQRMFGGSRPPCSGLSSASGSLILACKALCSPSVIDFSCAPTDTSSNQSEMHLLMLFCCWPASVQLFTPCVTNVKDTSTNAG